MINNLPLIIKVLTYVSQHKKVKLDETLIGSQSGFQRLAKEGLIEIKKIDNEYIASLTYKGLQILNS